MRLKLYNILEEKDKSTIGYIYNISLMFIILVNLSLLAFKETTSAVIIIDRITVVFFCIDYILRIITADYKLQKGVASFFIYPFTPLAIIDILCILPSLGVLSGIFRIIKVLRFFRVIRILRIFKLFRRLKSIRITYHVIKNARVPLISICVFAVCYVLVVALIMFNIEPDTFPTFLDAIYWSTMSLTTIGYGDIVPLTALGKIITMISAFMGIAIIAMPSGIIAGGYIKEVNNKE